MDLKDAARKLADADKAVRDEAMAAVLTAKDRAVPHLVDALATPGAPVAKIALLLAALGSRDGLPKLYELLDKNVLDLDTRAVIARALGELLDGRDAFDDGAKRSLLRLSRDAHTTTRQLTVKALEKVGDKECEDRLREMSLSDGDAATKSAATAAFGALRAARGPDDAGVPEAGGVAVDLEALVRQSSGPIPVFVPEDAPTGPYAGLILRLRDPRWAVRGAAVEEAVQKGKAAVPALVEVLTGRNAGAKIGAAQAVARIAPAVGAPEAVQPLVDIATAAANTDDEKSLKPIALKALACSLTGGEEGLAQPLLPLTRDADPFVRAGALLCLGRLADRVGARAATLALSDPHEHVKEAAAVALSEGTREEDQDLVLPLLAVLGGMPSPGLAVREAILLSLARIVVDRASPEGEATLLRLRHKVRPNLLGPTASLRRTALAVLERSYAADDPPPLGVVDDALGRLADSHPEVRLLAASFLAQFLEPGMTGAVEALEDALDKSERALSLLCLDALVRHDTAKSKAALEAATEDPDEAVAARAKELVATYAPKTEEWTAPAVEPAIEAAPEVDAPAVDESAPAEVAAPPEERSAPAPRRVRPAGTSGEVVEAKDSSASVEVGTLKERLASLRERGLAEDAAARARLFDAFVGKP